MRRKEKMCKMVWEEWKIQRKEENMSKQVCNKKKLRRGRKEKLWYMVTTRWYIKKKKILIITPILTVDNSLQYSTSSTYYTFQICQRIDVKKIDAEVWYQHFPTATNLTISTDKPVPGYLLIRVWATNSLKSC